MSWYSGENKAQKEEGILEVEGRVTVLNRMIREDVSEEVIFR